MLYASARWKAESREFLRSHPLCECHSCQAGKLRTREATVVDHLEPHRGDEARFWDRSNWSAKAKRCHDAKTAHEVNARRRAWRDAEGP